MAYLLFVDESGHDLVEAPYEVVAGVCVQDKDVWNLIAAIQDAERQLFGGAQDRHLKGEIKGEQFLKRKVFRQAAELPSFDPERRSELARQALEHGDRPTRDGITALAQAKLEFVRTAFEKLSLFHSRVFASIVDRDAPRPPPGFLRKDYAFLFERFFYFLEDRGPDQQGIIVFDELEKTLSKVFLGQVEHYFRVFAKGRTRARQIVPAPFFVHSDLTTLIQVADLIAYVVSWGFRNRRLMRPAREELGPYSRQLKALEYCAIRAKGGKLDFRIGSFTVLHDLRGKKDREHY